MMECGIILTHKSICLNQHYHDVPINALMSTTQSTESPCLHSLSASKSVRRPAYHVAMCTYKVALPASSKFTLTVPSNLFAQNYHLHSFLFCHLAYANDIGIYGCNFEFTERKPNPEKVSIIVAS